MGNNEDLSKAISHLEDLVSNLNIGEISSLKNQVNYLNNHVESLIKRMFSDGVNSLETKVILVERDISLIKKEVLDLKSDIAAMNDLKKELLNSIQSFQKDDKEIMKERIIGFWKWALVATPGIIALIASFFNK